MRFTTINYEIKNSVSYLPTILNGIQAAIEFDWNLKLGSSLYIKRLWAKRDNNAAFARSARRGRSGMRGEEKKQTYLAAPYLNFWLEFQSYLTTPLPQFWPKLQVNAIWPDLWQAFDFNLRHNNFAALFATPLAQISDIFDDANPIYLWRVSKVRVKGVTKTAFIACRLAWDRGQSLTFVARQRCAKVVIIARLTSPLTFSKSVFSSRVNFPV